MVYVPVKGLSRTILESAVHDESIPVETRQCYSSYLVPLSTSSPDLDIPSQTRYISHTILYRAWNNIHASDYNKSFTFITAIQEHPNELLLHNPESNSIYNKTPQKNADLEKRLKQIAQRQSELEYARMVADVAPSFSRNSQCKTNGKGNGLSEMYISSFRPQLSMGVNVIVTMLTCFAIGYFLTRVYFGENHPTASMIGGIVGLTIGLFLDVILVIARIHTIEKHASSKLYKVEGWISADTI